MRTATQARLPGTKGAPGTKGFLRLLVLAVLFGGLAALEISDGFGQLAQQRERHRQELLELIDRQQEILARRMSDLMSDGTRHAGHLARTPGVRDLLRGGTAEARAELGSWALPYLSSFAEVDRLSLLDVAGRERFRCERMGGGVAVLPAGLLDPQPAPQLVELAERAHGAEVAVSTLLYDEARVEVAESDRRVFRLVAAVEDDGRRLGSIVVTVYAAPLLRALAEFAPLPGATSCLVSQTGQVFAPEPRTVPGVVEWLSGEPEVLAQLLAGVARVELDGATLFARRTGAEFAAVLVTAISEGDLRASAPVAGVWRTALRTVLVLAAIGLGTALTVRANLQKARLSETQGYLARIREESDKHRSLMEAAADIILIVDPAQDLIADWNPRARQTLEGLSAGEQPALDTLEPAFGPEGLERLRAGVLQAAERLGDPQVVVGLVLSASDGAELAVDARCIGLEYGGRRMVELALSDRTRERASELRARTTERLSALGLLTAGVAHEINNPLAGIGNYLSLLERPDLEEERRAHYLGQVRRGFRRIGEITGQLLRFARKGGRPADEQAGTADLAEVVERASSMSSLSGDLQGVELRLEGLDRPVTVAGSGGRLEQIVLNLLLNAGRAMGGRGVIRISAVAPEPGWVELLVEDEGPGIEHGDLGRIFDPFFTRSGGTGLGLSVSYGIARAMGGELSASNRAEGGARFTLRLPRDDHGDADESQ